MMIPRDIRGMSGFGRNEGKEDGSLGNLQYEDPIKSGGLKATVLRLNGL